MNEAAREIATELLVTVGAIRNGILIQNREATQEEQGHIEMLQKAYCVITGGPMPVTRKLIKGDVGRKYLSAGMLMHYASEVPHDPLMLHTIFLDGAHTIDTLTERVSTLAGQVGSLTAELAASESRTSLVGHLEEQFDWQRETFGDRQRIDGVLDHIQKEITELAESDPKDPMEIIDLIFLLSQMLAYLGYTARGMATLWIEKLQINKKRTWPDWRTAPPNKAIEHVREDGGI